MDLLQVSDIVGAGQETYDRGGWVIADAALQDCLEALDIAIAFEWRSLKKLAERGVRAPRLARIARHGDAECRVRERVARPADLERHLDLVETVEPGALVAVHLVGQPEVGLDTLLKERLGCLAGPGEVDIENSRVVTDVDIVARGRQWFRRLLRPSGVGCCHDGARKHAHHDSGEQHCQSVSLHGQVSLLRTCGTGVDTGWPQLRVWFCFLVFAVKTAVKYIY